MAADEVLILAGGLGTRLRAAVPDLPKPLAPVAGRPFLAYLLDRYEAAGIRRVILAIGYLGQHVEQAVGARWGAMDVVYSRESEPLGTGGAIAQAARLSSGNGLHVCNGDTYLEYEPAALESAAEGLPIAIALASVPDVARYGAVDVEDGRVRRFREKGGGGPGLINAGSYFLTRQGLEALPVQDRYSFEQDVLEPWVVRGCVGMMAETSGFIDIGVPEDFARAQHLFARVQR
ncbi:sugar phosphate nucleotidyltransferase [Stenotrophomonas maltophilia]|uniref:sugar phosphate nucleotidyltransferase n=1 Tax=Stenotrophomonas maltophilia TaxID=40324 RepID=UPI00166164A8|nr:sugar phosphate nucleotidyltransferase [Stenotrophomonas maltophilia]